jgi:hypothetical protein
MQVCFARRPRDREGPPEGTLADAVCGLATFGICEGGLQGSLADPGEPRIASLSSTRHPRKALSQLFGPRGIVNERKQNM